MPSTPEPHEQWYVLHVLSGQENSVRDRIIRKAKDAELSDFIYRVEVPTELISEVRNGKKTERHSKLFPGYVYANMYLLEADGTLNKDLWYFIQQIDGVISIAGSRNSPLPMRKREVEDLLPLLDAEAVAARPKVEFAVGDPVRVCEGPFQSQEGTIEEIDPEKGKLRVSVSIFGRATPCGLGILAGGKSLNLLCVSPHQPPSRLFFPLTKQNHGKRNNQNHQAPDQCRSR